MVKLKNPTLEDFLDSFPQKTLLLKKSASSVFHPSGPLTSSKLSQKSPINRFEEKMLTDILTYWHTDGGSFMGPFPPKGGVPEKIIVKSSSDRLLTGIAHLERIRLHCSHVVILGHSSLYYTPFPLAHYHP